MLKQREKRLLPLKFSLAWQTAEPGREVHANCLGLSFLGKTRQTPQRRLICNFPSGYVQSVLFFVMSNILFPCPPLDFHK